MDKGFAACPRVRARKTRKNYKKTGLESARLWVTQQQGFYTLPPGFASGRKAATPQGSHAQARASVPAALAPVTLGFLGLLLLPLGHLGRSHDRLHRASHVVSLMACLAGR